MAYNSRENFEKSNSSEQLNNDETRETSDQRSLSLVLDIFEQCRSH